MKTITTIKPEELFSSDILNFELNTTKLGRIKYVNLDNAATTPPLKAVEEGVMNFLKSYGSVHRGAGEKSIVSTDNFENSRKIIKNYVNAPDDSYLIFTGNTTEAMNTAAHYFSFIPGKILVSSIEHSSSWLPWIKAEGIKFLGKDRVTLDQMESTNQRIQNLGRQHVLQYDINEKFEFDLDSIEKQLIENRIKALVLTASSNLTGYHPNIKRIGELAHKYGTYFIVDACQYIPHHKLDMQELGIDFLAGSGHKIYAPYGGGFLIGPKNFLDKFIPYQIGGGNLPYISANGEFLCYKNQLAHDPGTPNAVGAIAMGLALQTLEKIGVKNIEIHERKLMRKLYEHLLTNDKIEMYVDEAKLGTVLPFNIKNSNPHEITHKLNTDYGIGVRAGSFCVHHVVRKLLKITEEQPIIERVKTGDTSNIPALIRISIGLCNTEEDIDRLILALDDLTTN